MKCQQCLVPQLFRLFQCVLLRVQPQALYYQGRECIHTHWANYYFLFLMKGKATFERKEETMNNCRENYPAGVDIVQ